MSEAMPTVDLTNSIADITIDGDDTTGDRRVTITSRRIESISFILTAEQACYLADSLLGNAQETMITSVADGYNS